MEVSAAKRSDLLQNLVDSRQITPDGKEWLTLALDPFHDYSHQVAGYPDADCSQTVVSCYQYQATVSVPAGVAAGATWDMHVYNLPVGDSKAFSVNNLDGTWYFYTEPATTQNRSIGPLNIVKGPAGAVLGPAIPATANVTQDVLPPLADYSVDAGISRVIGMGYEIINTSAPLVKQGTLTAYRMPQLGNTFQMVARNNAGTFTAPVTGQMWREPPDTVAEANLLKGTRTWAAAEGAYVTCMQNSVHNPLTQLESNCLMFTQQSSPPGSGSSPTIMSQFLTVPGAATSPNASSVGFAPSKTMPYDTTGVFLTGLSYESTITVKVRFYVERAPTWTEPSLAVLASPSAGYDVKALELYAMAANVLPIAVKVNENAKGDWWRAVLSVVKAVAPPLGMALSPFIPAAGLVGTGIGKIAGQLDTSAGKSIAKQVQTRVEEASKVQPTKRPPRRQVRLIPQTRK